MRSGQSEFVNNHQARPIQQTVNTNLQSEPASRGETTITRQQWKWSALAGMASYLDAGSIVALGAGLAILQQRFGMTDGGSSN